MTATDHKPSAGRTGRRGWVSFAAAAVAAALTAGAIASAGGGTAGAADAPHAQSAGNFLDATIGGKPIDNIAKLAFARAQNPGSVTDQNPLDVTVLNAINLPLTGSLQLPQLLGIDLGAVNQVALAKSTGASYGAAGAVLNSGGVSVGGNNSSLPASAGIDLCASALNEGTCGSSPADALGEVKASINGVSSIARTPDFGPPLGNGWPSVCTQDSATCYDIASIDLKLSSPMLGDLLGSITPVLTNVLNAVTGLLSGVLPASCDLTPDLNFAGGVLDINGNDGSITVSVDALLKALNLDLNALPANTDLIDKVIEYLTSPDGLAGAVTSILDGVTGTLNDALTNCIPSGALGQLLTNLQNALNGGKTQLENTITNILSALGGVDLSALLGPLTDLLKNVLDIGVNVQPQVSSGSFQTALDTNPKQGMTPPPVPYEHTVRALEVKVLGSDGVTVALANSAAGPSSPPIVCCSPPTTAPPTNIPTGVPAGLGAHGSSPVLPLVLLSLALVFAAGGVVSYRMRGSLNRH